MTYLNGETLLLVLVLAAAGLAVLGLLALRAAHRATLRRRRQALQDTGLRLTFDACAPEGADLSTEPFRLARLRIEPVDERESAHSGPA
jgi:hypothetical protein